MCLGRFASELILVFPDFRVSADYDFFFGATINKVYLTNLCWMAEQSGKTVCHLRTTITEFHQPQWGEDAVCLIRKFAPLTPVEIYLHFEYRILVQVLELLLFTIPLTA